MSASPGRPGDADERRARLVHDLRTPLTIVLGFADLLRRRGDALDAEKRAEMLERIDVAARDMQRILDEDRAERHGDG